MKFGSLFAGIGGFDLGLERAGMTPAWQVEIDDYCNKVLEKHWPDVRRYRDVKEVGKHNLEPVDLICGGFPCQPYSVAGKRKGAEDDRNLWPDYLRIVRELRPTWVVGENVPGIVPMYLDQVLSDLESEEYTCWTFNIPACALDAPHRRERIFVVAYSNKYGWACGGEMGEKRQNQMDKKQYSKEGITNGSGRFGEFGKASTNGELQRPNEKYGSYSERVGREEGTIEQNLQSEKQMSGRQNTEQLREMVSNSTEQGLERTKRRTSEGERSAIKNGGSSNRDKGFWEIEPNVGRVANGVPSRVDRLKALGNAVVPQVAEYIGKQIIETENQRIKNHDYK